MPAMMDAPIEVSILGVDGSSAKIQVAVSENYWVAVKELRNLN